MRRCEKRKKSKFWIFCLSLLVLNHLSSDLKNSVFFSYIFSATKRRISDIIIFCCLVFFFFFLVWRFSDDGFFLVVRRDIWMISLHSFRNCKMRATQILWWKWCPSSLKILRNFSTIWREPCENLSTFIARLSLCDWI